jgi:hypothetical protein
LYYYPQKEESMKSKKMMLMVLVQGLIFLAMFEAAATAFGGHPGFHRDVLLKTVSQLNLTPQQWSILGPLVTNYENAVKGVRAAQKTLWTDLRGGDSNNVAADLKALESARAAARDQKKVLWTALDGVARNDQVLATALSDLKAERLARMKARLNSLCQKIRELGGTCSQ